MSTTRIALVTGSTSGIGYAIAERYAAGGIGVALHGLEPRGEEMAQSLSRRFGVRTLYSGLDLAIPESCERLVDEVERALGRLDILVNNAGVQHVAPIDDFPTDRWRWVLDINLSAPFYLSRAAWPGMKARGLGRIINVASVHGLRASEFKSAYVASKHGLVGLTKALALEGAPHGITVNALCPGYVQTPLVERQIQDQSKAHGLSAEQVVTKVMLQKQPIKQFIAPTLLAEAAWWLASEEASTITGTALPLDGGWTAQ